MVTWPRRLIAGLIMAMLTWAILPGREHSVPHAPDEASLDGFTQSSLEQAHVEHGSRCGPQATCSPAILTEQATAALSDASLGSTRIMLADDLWMHLHRHGREPPPPRSSA